MSHDHDHDESQWPIIWDVLDGQGSRITVLVQDTEAKALFQAKSICGSKPFTLINTGKRKPPNKCCNKCGNKPCGS